MRPVALVAMVAILMGNALTTLSADAAEVPEQEGYRQTVEDYTEGYVVPKVAMEVIFTRSCTPKAAGGAVNPAQYQDLNKLLTSGYPGSQFDCQKGNAIIVQPSSRIFFNNFKEERLEKDYGSFRDVWLSATDTVERSVGENSITIRINRAEPGKSAIIAATLPVLEEHVSKMVADGPSDLFKKGNLVRILNETYRVVYAPQEHTLLNFAYFVMSDPDVRQDVARQAQLAKTSAPQSDKKRGKVGQKSTR
jgi:hypothetical protein